MDVEEPGGILWTCPAIFNRCVLETYIWLALVDLQQQGCGNRLKVVSLRDVRKESHYQRL